MESGVGLIIRGWNRFYSRYDQSAVVESIARNMNLLATLRPRRIDSLSDHDFGMISSIFNDFYESLKRQGDNRRSAVSVAKALSLFAPHFFPIWDSNIAWKYNCLYVDNNGDVQYLHFCKKMKLLSARVRDYVPEHDDRPLLKRIDEYNYSKYTMHWI